MVPARFVFICKIVAAPSVAPLGEPLQEYLWNFRKYRGRRGRKRDFPDAERLVKRLVARELTLSFVPDAEQRLWRTVTRRKYQLTRVRVRLQNHLESLLEEAHIKLSSLVSDLLGASARRMLKALAEGETNPAALAAQRLQNISQLCAECSGQLPAHLLRATLGQPFTIRLHQPACCVHQGRSSTHQFSSRPDYRQMDLRLYTTDAVAADVRINEGLSMAAASNFAVRLLVLSKLKHLTSSTCVRQPIPAAYSVLRHFFPKRRKTRR